MRKHLFLLTCENLLLLTCKRLLLLTRRGVCEFLFQRLHFACCLVLHTLQ